MRENASEAQPRGRASAGFRHPSVRAHGAAALASAGRAPAPAVMRRKRAATLHFLSRKPFCRGCKRWRRSRKAVPRRCRAGRFRPHGRGGAPSGRCFVAVGHRPVPSDFLCGGAWRVLPPPASSYLLQSYAIFCGRPKFSALFATAVCIFLLRSLQPINFFCTFA